MLPPFQQSIFPTFLLNKISSVRPSMMSLLSLAILSMTVVQKHQMHYASIRVSNLERGSAYTSRGIRHITSSLVIFTSSREI